ncbi:MAG: hypothetical protein ACI9ES_003201 [Oceanospirillaceae bacterium]|jgi:hypothetical protein
MTLTDYKQSITTLTQALKALKALKAIDANLRASAVNALGKRKALAVSLGFMLPVHTYFYSY